MRLPHLEAVVKVGGSLYDLPDLATRLRELLAAELNFGFGVLVIPGGGPTVEAVREWDRRDGMGEEMAHWLALLGLVFNAHFLASFLPSTCVIEDVEECPHLWLKGKIPILDVYEFARLDDDRPGRLPHTWAVTSDAIAARVAVVTHARQLVLFKSTTIPPGVSWAEAGRLGYVDEIFAEVLRDAPAELRVSAVNLRTWPD